MDKITELKGALKETYSSEEVLELLKELMARDSEIVELKKQKEIRVERTSFNLGNYCQEIDYKFHDGSGVSMTYPIEIIYIVEKIMQGLEKAGTIKFIKDS